MNGLDDRPPVDKPIPKTQLRPMFQPPVPPNGKVNMFGHPPDYVRGYNDAMMDVWCRWGRDS